MSGWSRCADCSAVFLCGWDRFEVRWPQKYAPWTRTEATPLRGSYAVNQETKALAKRLAVAVGQKDEWYLLQPAQGGKGLLVKPDRDLWHFENLIDSHIPRPCTSHEKTALPCLPTSWRFNGTGGRLGAAYRPGDDFWHVPAGVPLW